MRHKVYNYAVKVVWLPDRRRQYYRQYCLAETTGPYVGGSDKVPYMVLASTIPGAISKLANVLRRDNIGRLNPNCERSDGIIGLNKWW